ncbi:MAG: hypothetical protein AAF648_02550 [Pseudomonadota bacterium]
MAYVGLHSLFALTLVQVYGVGSTVLFLMLAGERWRRERSGPLMPQVLFLCRDPKLWVSPWLLVFSAHDSGARHHRVVLYRDELRSEDLARLRRLLLSLSDGQVAPAELTFEAL